MPEIAQMKAESLKTARKAIRTIAAETAAVLDGLAVDVGRIAPPPEGHDDVDRDRSMEKGEQRK